ncbi:MAG: hypothetical protein IPM91_11495 [Bacteroidetes bacterium]|nr:hypothetical protein [Bacteroidota bacterium]
MDTFDLSWCFIADGACCLVDQKEKQEGSPRRSAAVRKHLPIFLRWKPSLHSKKGAGENENAMQLSIKFVAETALGKPEKTEMLKES